MNINEILGYSAYDSIEYQTGEGTEAPTFIYADADYEVGDGKCGLHETAKQANEPAIVYVRADSFLSRNEWLQERIDILTTANLWEARAKAAEAKVDRLHEAVHRSVIIFERNFERQEEMPPDLPCLLNAATAAIQNLSVVSAILRAALAAMEATDE